MIDIGILQTQFDDWQQSLDLLAGVSGTGLALLTVDGQDRLAVRLSSGHQGEKPSAEILTELIRLAAGVHLGTSSGQAGDPHSASQGGTSSLLDDFFALPLLWPSKAIYGVLCLFLPSCRHEALPQARLSSVSDGTRRLARLSADSIELQLQKIYRQQRRADMAQRGPVEDVTAVDLQMFVDSMKEHVWMKNTHGRYVLFNRSVELAWGKSRDEIINRTDEELFTPEIAKQFVNADIEAINKGIQISAGECQAFDMGSLRIWLETTKMPVVRPDGELAGVIGITRNISQHKAVQEQLELAARVFENSVEGVLITDRDGNIIEVHGAFTEITGYAREEVLGQNPRNFSSGRHDKAFYAQLWDALLTTGRWHGEIWNRRKNGAIFPQQLTISAMFDDEAQIRYFVAVFSDISAQKQSEADLAYLAFHDPLTNLPNRMTLSTQVEQEIRHAEREQLQLAMVVIDVDLFKHINESYGHLVGDKLLLDLAQRLVDKLDSSATVARLGGDEFAALLPNIETSDTAALLVSQLREIFELPFAVGADEQVRLTASMGIAMYPSDGRDNDTLLRNADAAMHRAKLDSRNTYAFYTESLTQQSVEHLKLQSALHDAMEKQAFHLVYQPKFGLDDRQVTGFEALLRWTDSQLGNVSPAVFIPVAEKIGLIHDMGLWVLRSACNQGVSWLKQGKAFGRIAVNVAGQQLQRGGFVEDVKQILLETGLPPRCLELEVTESFMMSDPETASRDLRLLGDLGIELSIDDFGTGYSSLNYLKQLPIHKLKIDQSFVRDIPFDTDNTAIAKAIIALGHALNLQVIAEGVETQAQADFLHGSGCDEAQGYLFSRPQLPEHLQRFLS